MLRILIAIALLVTTIDMANIWWVAHGEPDQWSVTFRVDRSFVFGRHIPSVEPWVNAVAYHAALLASVVYLAYLLQPHHFRHLWLHRKVKPFPWPWINFQHWSAISFNRWYGDRVYLMGYWTPLVVYRLRRQRSWSLPPPQYYRPSDI